jgi:ABC-type nitrate/sulfonate/bicarbonate transport system permease component
MQKHHKALSVLSIIALLGAWEAIARIHLLAPEIFPSFIGTFHGSLQLMASGEFPKHFLASAYRWAIGISVSIILSLPVGIWMARSKGAYHFFDPLLTLSYPVPKAAMIPILMLWMGAGDLSKVTVIILGCFIPLVISAYHGAQGVETSLIWSARAMGMSEGKILFRVILPASLPTVFSGIRMALAISLIVVLGSEMIARQSGLGYYLFNSLEMGLYDLTYSVLVIISAWGLLLDRAFCLVMKRVLIWA